VGGIQKPKLDATGLAIARKGLSIKHALDLIGVH